ncbi:hypothetical protein SO694_0020602 [Aureococcus anophagefferens]|uniref:GYF domain-containing protein n=1 Tax=Aureococcus anophagefferens TaxID=44056 RepID=A0ABR1FNM6_AURAN
MANRYGYDYPDLTSDDSNDIKRVLAEREANPGAAPRGPGPAARGPATSASISMGMPTRSSRRPTGPTCCSCSTTGTASSGSRRPRREDRGLRRRASSALEARQKENEAARANEQDAEPAHWCFLDPQGAVQGPYHRLQMRFWFEKGFFEMKTPVRFGLSGPFTMLGDAFGAAAAGEYVWAFLDDAAIAKKRDQAEELKNRPTQNPHGTWKQKHLKVPATRENPFPNEDFESPGQELYWCAHAGETLARSSSSRSADVLWRNHNEQCILSAAAKAGDVEIIRALVKCGAPPSHENIWHMTPLHEA